MSRNFLITDPEASADVLRALSAPARGRILRLLARDGALNVNDIAAALDLPQSTASAHVQALERAGLLRSEVRAATKGSQKLCHPVYDEILISFRPPAADSASEVAMPLGLYTSCEVSAPCGLCSTSGIIGLLDVPDTFLDPGRMDAALLWFTRGYVEYQFPNNSRLMQADLHALEARMELSSEVPGTAAEWPSDITVSINGTALGTWTSPGDFGDRRGTYTPGWWGARGSQYGMLKTFRVTAQGSFVDGVRIGDTTLSDLGLNDHRSIRLRIAVAADARHPGGVNIFGRGFGNYDQDIVLRLVTG